MSNGESGILPDPRAKHREGKARYNYNSPEHRRWRKETLANGRGVCYACGRKPKRKHAHHIYGTSRTEGVTLCPTCHELVTILAGHGYRVFSHAGRWRKLRWLVKERVRGEPE